MNTSKSDKTYDTSDGSEHPSGRGQQEARGGGRHEAQERWEDDGGMLSELRPIVLAKKPGWSVLSQRDLLAAIARTDDPNDAVRLHHEARQAEDARARATGLRNARTAEAACADATRHRNPWENT